MITLISTNVLAKTTGKDITFANHFFTEEVKQCDAMPNNTFSSKFLLEDFQNILGFDWSEEHTKNGTSLDSGQAMIGPVKKWKVATHNALVNNNEANIQIAIDLAVDLAEANQLYNTINRAELQHKPMCWENSDPNAPCYYHEYQGAMHFFGHYLTNVIKLKSSMTKAEIAIIDKYVDGMWKRFMKPDVWGKKDSGFYQFANGGMTTLTYAAWTGDKKLAAKEINFRFKELSKLILDDGYINNNSFRGSRAQWYHSLGVQSALGYVYIAKLWGAEVPPKLQKKLTASAELVNLAIVDWDKFKSRKWHAKVRNAVSKDLARKFTHQHAYGIAVMMKEVTGVKFDPTRSDDMHASMRMFHVREGIDEITGFNALCISSVESVKPIVKVVDYSLKQVTGNDWRKNYQHVSSN